MSVDVVLRCSADEIVEEAYGELHPSVHPHYHALGESPTRSYLAELCGVVVRGVADREAVHMVEHAERIAEERYHAGFDLSEVQAAFNAVEQAMWRRVTTAEEPGEMLASVGVLSSVLGAGKDALARVYVLLASQRHAPHVDVAALYAGTDGATTAR
jgi:hypothetical protein